MNYDKIPQELKTFENWVCYRTAPRSDGSLGKIPVNPKTLTDAKADDPSTWGTFEQAVTAAARNPDRVAGIGFEFGNSPFFGVDLDHVMDDAGRILPEAQAIINALDSYTEYSPSGSGVHILCRGSYPDGWKKKKAALAGVGDVEMYQTGRYFTVTGKPYGTLRKLQERSQEAAKLQARYNSTPERKSAPEAARAPQAGLEMADGDLLQVMFKSRNGAEIEALWNGDDRGDHSAADMALVNHLLFWTYWDTGAVDLDRVNRLFESSGLMRDKWRRPESTFGTYGNRTLQQALKGFNPPSQCRTQASAADFDDLDAQPSSPVGSEPTQAPAPVEKRSAADIIDGFFDKVQSEIYKPISTSFSHLDDFLGGGLLVKSFVLIGAGSSMGKTTFAQQMVENMAVATGRDVVYFPLEMGVDALLAKSISRVTFELRKSADQALRADQVLQGYKWAGLTPDQRGALEEARAFIKRRHTSVYYADLPNANADAFLATLERYQTPGKPAPFIVLDYIQLLQGGQRDDAASTIKRATKALHDYAIKNDTIVFAITAFNREATKGGRAQLESARDTSDLEYSMDYGFYFNFWDYENTKELKKDESGKVLQPGRDELKNDKPRRISIKIVKNRLGPTDVKVGFKYYSAYNYFESASHADMKAAYLAAEDARKWQRMGVDPEYPDLTDSTDDPFFD